MGRRPKGMTAEQRFREKVVQLDDCHEWVGVRTPGGYGQMWLDGRKQYAHRISYEWHVGPIPAGLVIDHLCRNRKCVNPEHLEAVTMMENNRRGDRYFGTATHCKAGHEWLDETTRFSSSGARICVICYRKYDREYKQKMKAKEARNEQH